jgi:hypothetical protein
VTEEEKEGGLLSLLLPSIFYKCPWGGVPGWFHSLSFVILILPNFPSSVVIHSKQGGQKDKTDKTIH